MHTFVMAHTPESTWLRAALDRLAAGPVTVADLRRMCTPRPSARQLGDLINLLVAQGEARFVRDALVPVVDPLARIAQRAASCALQVAQEHPETSVHIRFTDSPAAYAAWVRAGCPYGQRG